MPHSPSDTSLTSNSKSYGEIEDPIALANRVLDRNSADPDDDLAILARQLLRRQEWAEAWHRALETVATILEVPSCGSPEMLVRDISAAVEKLRSPPETNGDGWIACSERMPAHGLKVMAFFRNKLGKGRTVFAHHFEKLKERADNYEIDYDTPDDWFDTDESGESYIPEGWYENSETHEQELKLGDEILFWRPMLASPEKTSGSDFTRPDRHHLGTTVEERAAKCLVADCPELAADGQAMCAEHQASLPEDENARRMP